MDTYEPLTAEALEAGLELILASPHDQGSVEMIVCRPGEGLRTVLVEGVLDTAEGLLGDTWKQRPSSRMPDRAPHPEMQLTLMNSRVIALLARTRDRWPLAGDQLLVDLDLSADNLPPGTRLEVGEAVVVVTAQAHTGCAQFSQRFGAAALQFVNGPAHRALHLRGINTRIVQSGRVRTGDRVRVLERPAP